ncbi:uncharacterized protein LOC115091183 [Rhinatrema bivittatum]|uniref:uncharacterized protein LOC115091183 n=1 Tax=Rhinatrema bivittatum TaxID=194408 RepID=UPI001127B337|nr:uncharacterized protein LOC115091183 [Rhinatrema bivittatum]XP_029457043.1 uncharacterized protein LOC115091183 [Rhinatrema bivittatum]XP_029457044.1 uncharacterized protein LOC115091183 [Rhinatrema bivittatum]
MSPGGISLTSTPIAIFGGLSTPKRRCTVTPLCLPTVTPASVPLSVNKFGSRVNPLHPPGIRRRTVSLETMAAHHFNQQRAIVMQQKEYCRYHQGWQRPFYGSVAEKEEYRQELRQLLKKQMSEKWAVQRQMLKSQAKDAETAREADRLALLHDLEQERTKAAFLQRFRDENKKLMEIKWKENRLVKSLENMRERELLKYNPINWSGTLK